MNLNNSKIVNNREEWDKALLALPAPHILQSWDWGEFKSRWSWQAERLLFGNSNNPVAAAQILRRSIPGTPFNFLYVSKGPILDYTNSDLVGQVLTGLESYARRTKALFIKIDPDVPLYYGEPQFNPPQETAGQAVLTMLEQHGWHLSPEQIQFRNTVVIDLTPELNDLLATMKSKWRYNIRLAGRKGVVIRSGGVGDIGIFYRMYAETATRDGFLIRPEAYYRDVWQSFLATSRAEILLASVDGQDIAGLLLFMFGKTAWYLYGASTIHHRRLMPNYLLQWQAICNAREHGCTVYDMWGAPDIFDSSDNMWGVYRFKRGFGGQAVQGLGAFDYPVNRPLYWAFTKAMPRLRSLWRRVRGVKHFIS